jgi:cytochrome oxidase Cu insertion factor (SCO1/SenC/PrrC family)
MNSVAGSQRGPRGWPLGAPATALLVGACLVAGAAGGVALHRLRVSHTPAAVASLPSHALAGDVTWPPGKRPAPAFTLRDQANRLVSLSSRRGRAVLLTFMDSQCKLLCTLQGPAIARVLHRAGLRSRRVSLMVVSVNPWEDTAASSHEAAARYGFAGDWHWLRGTPAELQQVWNAYGIGVERTSDDVNHSTAIYLIDGRGFERAGFNFPFPSAKVVRDLTTLAS